MWFSAMSIGLFLFEDWVKHNQTSKVALCPKEEKYNGGKSLQCLALDHNSGGQQPINVLAAVNFLQFIMPNFDFQVWTESATFWSNNVNLHHKMSAFPGVPITFFLLGICGYKAMTNALHTLVEIRGKEFVSSA